ncbi:heavy metal translocating P-type ATPase [Trueperella abortisuis]|uniref:Cd2+/Zn2+-exporting ATPase n=1 Tax=Trueperella abortisuis TaxID=445930 RepID=A0ABT9PKY5_9ACTO|nr:cation-translocating P-type ATPase [Trueperella abortisuis]MDP9833382.1 Cd2+/Zn2+-exporting ATPase [Trueperella abortisuis]
MFTQWLTSLQAKKYISLGSATLLVVVFLLSRANTAAQLQEGILIAVSVAAGIPILISAVRALTVKAFSIDLLVTIAVAGALIIGEYVESAVVAFLFIFGTYLEVRTLAKTRESLKNLIDMAPKEAEVIRHGESVVVNIDDVEVGDRVVVRVGGQIPIDGTVVKGEGAINEAAVTGEPVAVVKSRGDSVWSGTVAETGYLEVRADRVGEDTTFSQIIELVEEAQDSKAPTQKFLDKFANIYTPAIIVAAIVAWAVTKDVRFALTLLVIACPGALVISTPVSLVAGLGNASKHGALIKGGDALERFAKIDTLVMDKTGTVTEGRPEVNAVVTFNGFTEAEVLAAAGSLEQASEHPLGRMIVASAREAGLDLSATPSEVTVIRGKGIEGRLADRAGTPLHVVVGSARMFADLPSDARQQAAAQEQLGNTVSFVALDGRLAGFIAISDRLRPEVADSIAALRDTGIRAFVMLTGDNRHTANAVAQAVGIDEVYAELMPADKVSAVENLKAGGHTVAMIGDGVNDAPAIATADLGIAMGGGTDVSMESADVVLVGNRFDQLLQARATARATAANMRQNTAIALITVFFLIAGVLFDMVHMGSGMFIHQASVIIVVLNAMRLITFRNASAQRIASRPRTPEPNAQRHVTPAASPVIGSQVQTTVK